MGAIITVVIREVSFAGVFHILVANQGPCVDDSSMRNVTKGISVDI